MIDLDILDTQAQHKLQSLLKKHRQQMLEAQASDLINHYFDAKTLEEDENLLLGKYPSETNPLVRVP